MKSILDYPFFFSSAIALFFLANSTISTDVLVIGGGTGGTAAAIQSASEGVQHCIG